MNAEFGGYTILDTLAVGGMAEVFLARRNGGDGFEKHIVIKRIRPHLSAVPSFVAFVAFVEMFLQEAKLAARLAHPNIVQIDDLGRIDGSYLLYRHEIHGWTRSVSHYSGSACAPDPVPD